jgi:peptidoglycan L-alanyl-D-glutamate endopeptidase CwlK
MAKAKRARGRPKSRKAKKRAVPAAHASSRNVADLHPELARRWLAASADYNASHTDGPQVFLTQTYRSRDDQAVDYAKGRSAPGKVVTNAKPGQSLHNYYPALAFDVAFKQGAALAWDVALFAGFAVIAKSYGLAWGGDWKTFRDNPHFEPPDYGWRMASRGVAPQFA